MCFTGQVECSNKAADDFKSIHAAPLDRKLRKLSRSTFFFNQISLHSTTKTFAICTSQRNDNQSSEYTLTSVYAVTPGKHGFWNRIISRQMLLLLCLTQRNITITTVYADKRYTLERQIRIDRGRDIGRFIYVI